MPSFYFSVHRNLTRQFAPIQVEENELIICVNDYTYLMRKCYYGEVSFASFRINTKLFNTECLEEKLIEYDVGDTFVVIHDKYQSSWLKNTPRSFTITEYNDRECCITILDIEKGIFVNCSISYVESLIAISHSLEHLNLPHC